VISVDFVETGISNDIVYLPCHPGLAERTWTSPPTEKDAKQMHGQLVCGFVNNSYVLATRSGRRGARLGTAAYDALCLLRDERGEVWPSWLSNLVENLGVSRLEGSLVSDMIQFRTSPGLGFARASFELTERCNFRCGHCYLGGSERTSRLTLEQKLKILETIEASGCLWLQLTGGEPLIDPDFESVYSHAQDLGLLVTVSTNGYYLARADIQRLFSSLPPHRLTVSLYGASPESYERLTGVRSAYARVTAGLHWARESEIRMRVNIMRNIHNDHELEGMRAIASKCSADYHVFSTICPTLDGSSAPLELCAVPCDSGDLGERDDSTVQTCNAGKTFFNVDCNGQASICKIARSSDVNLLGGLEALQDLPGIANRLLAPPTRCGSCSVSAGCRTCAPQLSLYERCGSVPAKICAAGATKDGKGGEPVYI